MSTFLYTGGNPVVGSEIFRLSDTRGTIQLVHDINAGLPSGVTSSPYKFGVGALFSANDGIHGQELWYTDGTSAGTRLVTDIAGGIRSSYPQDLVVAKSGKAYFWADTYEFGEELWVTDGTSAGTHIVADMDPGSDGARPSEIHAYQQGVLFKGQSFGGLWFADDQGVRQLATVSPWLGKITVAKEKAFFLNSGNDAEDLYVYDADLKSAYSLFGASNPFGIASIHEIVAAGDKVVAKVEMITGEGRLLISDGTLGGTSLLSAPNVAMAERISASGDHIFYARSERSNDKAILSISTGEIEYLTDYVAVWTSVYSSISGYSVVKATTGLVGYVDQILLVRDGDNEVSVIAEGEFANIAYSEDGRVYVKYRENGEYSVAVVDLNGTQLTKYVIPAHGSVNSFLEIGGKLSGTTVDDTLTGGAGDDVIEGRLGNDSLIAGIGDDIVYGGAGRDTLSGGEGNDLLYGGDGADSFDGSYGLDTLYGGSGNDTIDGDDGDDNCYGQLGNDVINGQLGNDKLYGGDGFDRLDGGEGNDSVWGGNGRDKVFLGIGDDIFFDNGQTGELGRDTVYAGAGNDTIQGGGANDEFHGLSDNDLIFGRLGDDKVFGGDGFDTLDGGEGNDTVVGGNGRDRAILGNGNDLFNDNAQGGDLGRDTVFAGAGEDTIQGGNGNDDFYGAAGDDLIFGRLGDDKLFGGDGNDTLDGGDGTDSLWGGSGSDQLTGGAGLDTFFFADGFGTDTVFGFDAADGEKVSLAGVTAITDFEDMIANHLNNVGGTAQIVDGANTILLNGVAFADVGVGLAYSVDDFIF